MKRILTDLTIANAVCGGIFAAGGAVTALLDSFGNAGRYASVAFGGFGALQLVTAAVLQKLEALSGTPAPNGQ
jgi:hypothetical protein